MRIDRYLHCIRLVKSCSLAQELVEQGHVRRDRRHVANPEIDAPQIDCGAAPS